MIHKQVSAHFVLIRFAFVVASKEPSILLSAQWHLLKRKYIVHYHAVTIKQYKNIIFLENNFHCENSELYKNLSVNYTWKDYFLNRTAVPLRAVASSVKHGVGEKKWGQSTFLLKNNCATMFNRTVFHV